MSHPFSATLAAAIMLRPSAIQAIPAPGTLDAGFNIGTGTDSYIISTTLQPDGKVLIGGAFNSFGSTLQNRIAQLNVLNALSSHAIILDYQATKPINL